MSVKPKVQVTREHLKKAHDPDLGEVSIEDVWSGVEDAVAAAEAEAA